VTGDFTASRKAKRMANPGQPSADDPIVNALYLEWFSECNGRVVIESADFDVQMLDGPEWTMTEADEQTQREANQAALEENMRAMLQRVPELGFDDGEPSAGEREADEEAARMDELDRRIAQRLEDDPEADFDEVWEEEREKLRIERNEPAPEPLTPEQEAEHAAWIEELNRIWEEAEQEAIDHPKPPPPAHPLVEECSALRLQIYQELRGQRWIDEHSGGEHPLRRLREHVQIASAKLAGALHSIGSEEEWPPDRLYAGNTLVRLKKARAELAGALQALEAAGELELATPAWRDAIRPRVQKVMDEVLRLIDEVREVLE